jgi:hypothetical protein
MFITDHGQLLFCLWLDWDERWVAWNMADGALVTLASRQIQRLNLLERDRALAEIKSGKAGTDAYNFLGRTKVAEDRVLIEEWLNDTTYGTGSIQSSSSESPQASFTYISRSDKREEADRILARWDGLLKDRSPIMHDNYFFLGTIRGQVHLAQKPPQQGALRLYLVPTETPLQNWAEREPQQYLTADLAALGPYGYENGKHVRVGLDEMVNFMIYGVTPGKYRLKAVLDIGEPFCDPKAVVCLPAAGDYVSVSSPIIEIKKGAVTEGVRLECTELVK